MRRLYLEEYIKVWDEYIADVRLVKLDSLDKSLQVARLLSGVDSPLAAFLRAVARETTLVEPSRRRPTSGTKVGNVDQKAAAGQAGDGGRARQVKVPGAETRRRGPPLEQMVDDHFAPMHRLVAGHAAADRRDHEALQRGLRAARRRRRGAEEQVGPPPAGGGERVKAAAGQQPEPARSVLEKLAGAAATQGRAVEREGLTGELKPISDFCNRAITGRYPFAASSKADVLPDDFGQLFGVGGMLDDFFQRQLAALVDTGATPWTFKPPATAPGRSRRRAGRLPARGAHPGGVLPRRRQDAGVQGRPARGRDGRRPEGADARHRRHGLQVPRRQHRGGDADLAERARRLADPAVDDAGREPLLFDGPWALFRLFDRFEVQPSAQPERFVVPILLDGKRARSRSRPTACSIRSACARSSSSAARARLLTHGGPSRSMNVASDVARSPGGTASCRRWATSRRAGSRPTSSSRGTSGSARAWQALRSARRLARGLPGEPGWRFVLAPGVLARAPASRPGPAC